MQVTLIAVDGGLLLSSVLNWIFHESGNLAAKLRAFDNVLKEQEFTVSCGVFSCHLQENRCLCTAFCMQQILLYSESWTV